MIKKIALLGTIILFTLLFIYCTTDESTIIGPFGNADKYLSVASLTANKTTVYSNGDVSIVSIKVLDVDNSPVIGLKVDFTTEFGSITASDITDSSGIALATFTSDENTGANIITVDTGIKKYTLTIDVINYQPKYIELFSASPTLLADGISSTSITAILKDNIGNPMPDMTVNFETTVGLLSEAIKLTTQEGKAIVTLRSAGNIDDVDAVVTVAVKNTNLSETVSVRFSGISMTTYIDSAKMSDNGIYKAFIKTKVVETTTGANISSGAVLFTSHEGVGTMNPVSSLIDDQGTAFSEFNVEVLPSSQNNVFITSELSSASQISSESEGFDIPGAEILINTIGDYIMGDGEGWALIKATLREADNNNAIPSANISWLVTLGTIFGKNKTNSRGETIDTLRIEKHTVSDTTDVTITANFGDYISATETLTFIPPINSNNIILGFESDTTGKGIIPCDLYNSIAIKEAGVSALFVDGSGDGINGQRIYFSIVPNNLAAICPSVNTRINGLAMAMLAYPPQSTGQIIRIWGEAPDGTKGSIDVILP